MRLMACFGVVVLLVILDSLSKALATAEVSNFITSDLMHCFIGQSHCFTLSPITVHKKQKRLNSL